VLRLQTPIEFWLVGETISLSYRMYVGLMM